MNLFVRFKLTTELPLERFKNLSPAVRPHTSLVWDGSEIFYWCEKHDQYFEDDGRCPACQRELDNPGQTSDEFKTSD